MSALLWGNCAVFRPVNFICPDMADNGNIFRTPGGGTALLPPASPVCASVAGGIDCHVLHSMPCHFVAVELLIGWSAVTSTRRAAEYVIVLGAKVRGSELSNSLKKRLDKALEYAENNPNTVLVLSGGKGRAKISARLRPCMIIFSITAYRSPSCFWKNSPSIRCRTLFSAKGN